MSFRKVQPESSIPPHAVKTLRQANSFQVKQPADVQFASRSGDPIERLLQASQQSTDEFNANSSSRSRDTVITMEDLKSEADMEELTAQNTAANRGGDDGRSRRGVAWAAKSLIVREFEKSSYVRIEHHRLHGSHLRFRVSQYLEMLLLQTFVPLMLLTPFLFNRGKDFQALRYVILGSHPCS